MYPFPAPNDDCTTCKTKVGAIFQELLKPKAQEVFVAEIQRDLKCEIDPDMTDDILCSDNADKIVLFLGQEVDLVQQKLKMFAKQRMELAKKLGLKLPVLMISRTLSIQGC